METLTNIAAKIFGFGGLWAKIDGYKTYLGGMALILGGLSSMFAGAAALAAEAQTLDSLGAAVAWAKGIGNQNAWTLILGGYASVSQGLVSVGLRHAQDKAQGQISNGAPKP